MKPLYFSLNIKLFFLINFGSGLESGFESGSEIRIRNRIRNVYFGSGSDPDPAKSFGSLRIRIRFRIRNTVCLGYLEDLDEDPHGMVEEGLVLRMGDNKVKAVAQLLHCLQLVFVLRL